MTVYAFNGLAQQRSCFFRFFGIYPQSYTAGRTQAGRDGHHPHINARNKERPLSHNRIMGVVKDKNKFFRAFAIHTFIV
jgi:hypothetical protein